MIQGILFDVDGTLYHQSRMRALMAAELGVATLIAGGDGRTLVLRVLRTFRRVREDLRRAGGDAGPLEELRYSATAARSGAPVEIVRRIVAEWIFTRPLRYMRLARRTGVRHALQSLADRGLRLGAFSDYPTADKLRALGLDDLVALQVCATDPDVNAFKPDPRGFLVACERWGLSPGEVVYVGDRDDVDGAGALAGGMRCLIIGRRRGQSLAGGVPLASFAQLPGTLEWLASRPDTPTTPSLAGDHR